MKKNKKLSKHNMPNDPSPKQLANLKNPGVELPISVYKQVLKHAHHSSAYAIPICLCSYPFFHSKVQGRCTSTNALTNGLFSRAIHQVLDHHVNICPHSSRKIETLGTWKTGGQAQMTSPVALACVLFQKRVKRLLPH